MRIETDSQHYTDIAEAIRVMNGTENTYYPEEMAPAVLAIPRETYDVYAPIIYSLEEREVGVWTDGKPLYQKTWIFTIPNSSGMCNFDALTPNLEKIIATSYSTGSPIPGGEIGYTPWYSAASVLFSNQDSEHVNFYFSGTHFAGLPLLYTSQYTKTTDVAGSGTWGTDGVPMVHYDGTERIIGTWFGETLYQKTVHINSLPSTPDIGTTYPHNISNINNVINFQAVARWSDGTVTHLNHLAVPLSIASSNISITVNKTNITFVTGTDRSSMSADVTIQYTKTSS